MDSPNPKKKVVTEIFVLFLLYTAVGISTEAIFTGVADIIRDQLDGKPFNYAMPSRTNLWIIPVYAVSATLAFGLIGAWAPKFFRWPWWARGLVYMFGIYCFEFAWALALETLFDIHVWKYLDSEYRIWRYTNPYFCVFWFSFGFALEKVKLVMLPRLLR